MQHHELKLESNKLIQLLWGIDPITFRVLYYLGVLALIVFYCWNTNYRQMKSTQLIHHFAFMSYQHVQKLAKFSFLFWRSTLDANDPRIIYVFCHSGYLST